MQDKRIDINLQIAEIPVPLKGIRLSEEEVLREAAKGINERWNDWRKRYPSWSPNEALALVVLTYAKAYLTLKKNVSDTERLLKDLEKTLDEMIGESLSN